MFGRTTPTTCLAPRSTCLTGLLAGVLVTAALTGCGAPAMVEGVVADEAYRIQDDRPALRMAYGRMDLVLSEEDGERLRVVALTVPEVEALPLGEPVELTLSADTSEVDGRPYVSVSVGDLVANTRGDGVRIVSSENNTFADIASGTVVLYDVDDMLTGELVVELADGGHLTGSFAIPLD